MREIISVSVPTDTKDKLRKQAKIKGFNTLSSYLVYLARLDEAPGVTADEILALIKEAQTEYDQGESIQANSLKDLL